MYAWYRRLRLIGVLGVLLLSGCSAPNPLLGSWTFERYTGGGDLGSVLGGFAATFSKGTTIEFTASAMIISQDNQKSTTQVDHYVIKGQKVTVWLKTSPTVIHSETYTISKDGQEMSSEIAGSGMKEVFSRASSS